MVKIINEPVLNEFRELAIRLVSENSETISFGCPSGHRATYTDPNEVPVDPLSLVGYSVGIHMITNIERALGVTLEKDDTYVEGLHKGVKKLANSELGPAEYEIKVRVWDEGDLQRLGSQCAMG